MPRPFVLDSLFRSLTVLPGIGPKNGKLFEKLIGGGKILDLLWHKPVDFIDRSHSPKIAEAQDGRIATLELTVQKAGRPRVVIIQGDHGYRFYTDAKLDAAFENLNAYYFSDGDYSLLYNGISPVNAFRVVLNKYFGCSLPLLKDSSVRIRHPRIRN